MPFVFVLAVMGQLNAQTTLGPWVPIFKGVDHAVGTNIPGSGASFNRLQVVHTVRVDLTDPDIRLFVTPRYEDYTTNGAETAAMKVGYFLTNYSLQVAINANDYHSPTSSSYLNDNAKNGTAAGVTGLLISDGTVVSTQESLTYCAALMFTSNKVPSFSFTNYPQHSIVGISNAVTGTYAVLINGVNVGSNYIGNSDNIHQVQPRTAMGISTDKRYLYLMTIDGRQSGYSLGAYDWETGGWLKLVGASDGINMDGGGSTTLDMSDAAGHSVAINRSSLVWAYGYERTVGAHLGIYAKAVEGVVYNVTPSVDETTATINWATLNPATGQVLYGLDTNYEYSTTVNSELTTNHSVNLTGLSPNTGYYFKAVSTIGTNEYDSPDFYFVTSNYVSQVAIFDITNEWRYTTDNQNGFPWTGTDYDDSLWLGPAPATFWCDYRGANEDIPSLSTEMPADSGNWGFPFVTYYFRTHFAFTNNTVGASLLLDAYVDDGAVFYLNGVEIYRLRMAASPTAIYNSTVATGYPCDGDPTCGADSILLTGDTISSLVEGDNVLAVEVHNLDPQSPDVVFGLALNATVKLSDTTPAVMSIVPQGKTSTISWTGSGYTLMQADAVTGTWTTVSGTNVASPFTVTNSATARFYRLQK